MSNTEDPSEFFSMIFGGEAFVDLIGEISLMKDLTATMDITMEQMEEEELAASAEEKLNIHDEEMKAAGTAGVSTEGAVGASSAAGAEKPQAQPAPAASGQSSGTSTPRRYMGQQALMDKSEEEARMEAAGLSQEEKELRKKEKKKGLSKE
jgi:hypothetical protein